MKVIYKFKITLEDEEEDFLREIEIDADSTFEEFHFAILEAVGLSAEELASFFICDSSWVKSKEITLLDMSEEENKIDIMSECKLKNFIEDSDQKLIYEYDFLNMWTFLIELEKTKPPQAKTKYPRCVKKIGKLTPRSKVAFNPSDLEDEFVFPGKDLETFAEEELEEGFGFESEGMEDDLGERQY